MWDDVVGHAAQKQYLQHYLKAQERPHALLFSGPDGLGKRQLALEFAKTLLCVTHTGTDNCKACRLMNLADDSLSHPDFFLVKRELEEKEGKIRYKDISKDQIKELIQQAALTPAMSHTRVCVIEDADTLCNGTAAPANAFLKLLEEPPEGWVIILLTSKPDKILPTILSRVVQLRFQSIELPLVEQVLVQKGVPATEAPVLARIAEGSIGQALRLYAGNSDVHKTNAKDYNALAMRAQAWAFLEALPLSAPLNYIAGRSWQAKGYQKLDALLLVQMWQLLLYDLLLCKLQLYDRIYNIDLLDELKAQAGTWELAALKRVLSLLQATHDDIAHDAGAKAALEAIALKIDQIYKE